MKKIIRYWKQIGIALILIAAALIVVCFVLRNTTYQYAEVVKTYDNKTTHNGKYIKYADGVLEYSRDGIAMLTKTGEEIWNQPCQMGNPMAQTCENAAVVADKGGTNIYVFQRDGLKGEIQTTKPIEKVTVSAQGIVAVILQNESNPMIICYDAKGNLLAELNTSLSKTGYPVAIALSEDGKVLLVSYLCTRGNGVLSTVSFYNFEKGNEGNTNYQVAQKEYVDTIVPTVAFIDKDTSLLVTDKSLVVYEGLDEPKEVQAIVVKKEIQSVAYDDEYIAMVLRNSGETKHELCLYRYNGKKMMSVDVEGEYTDLKIEKNQVFLYDEKKCAIYNNAGVCKFKGNLEVNILDMFPSSGFNKYTVISASGFQQIQLAK